MAARGERLTAPEVRTNARGLRWTLSPRVPVTGSIEIDVGPEHVACTGGCVYGSAVVVPNEIAFRFILGDKLRVMDVHLCADLAAPALCNRSFSLAGHDPKSTNVLRVVIEKGIIQCAYVNDEELQDVTPYAWKVRLNHVELCMKTLEDLFGCDWFVSESRTRDQHPAYQEWMLLTDILSRGLVYPDHFTYLPQLARSIFDSSVLQQCTRGDVDRGLLGSLGEYGSPRVATRIGAEIVDPLKYGDVMVELMYAAWHLSRGHDVHPTDEEGTADFELCVPGHDLPIYADCKRVRTGTSDKRFPHIISKANRQVKESAKGRDCLGLVVIDIAERVASTSVLTDCLPPEVQSAAAVVQAALAEHNSSLGAAILLWNDFVVRGQPPLERASLVCMRRRSLIVRHRQPRFPLPDTSVLSEIGNTVEFKVFWQSRESPGHNP